MDADKMIADPTTKKEAEDACCDSCGTTEIDGIKLKTCNACKLVRYCSVTCQREHRPRHKQACKERAAELRDELLFKQPENTHLGDCPICSLPLSLDMSNNSLSSCCCVLICDGCAYANQMRDIASSLEPKCPFCREAYASTEVEAELNLMKRIQAGDRVAIRQKGCQGREGQNYSLALEYLTKAAKMGDASAHLQLGQMYFIGQGFEMNTKKACHHFEEAAIGGHPEARHNLGVTDAQNCRPERAVKHFIIAASQGFQISLETLKVLYADGVVRKNDLAAALYAYQAAVDSTKSPQRNEAKNAPRIF